MSLSPLLLPGGFALLTTSVSLAAGLGGPAAGLAAGAATYAGVVTGLVPLVAGGALGVIGEKSYKWKANSNLKIDWLLSGLASMLCVGPAYCTTPGGQCCLLAMDPDLGALVCPLSCST